MSDAKTSPAPWRWFQSGLRRMPVLHDADGNGVIIWGRDTDSCSEGDMALIASAPTLRDQLARAVALLRRMFPAKGEINVTTEDYHEARALLAEVDKCP